MIAATLFSGIGAPETAMPHWRWPWHAEIERFPNAVMAHRHPGSINLGDVTAHDFAERALAIARPDVLVFGSPCQSFSVAGRCLGLDDPRGNLALCALRIVARIKPAWFVFENVPGLLSSANGSDFGLLLRTVDELGYSASWAMLDAQYFGLAQRRERLFLVGHSGDWRRSAAVLLEPEGLCGDTPPRREARQAVASGLGERAYGGNDTRGPIDLATACRAKGGSGHGDFESETFVTHAILPPERTPTAVRRLTPREAERLQGYPNDYTLVEYRNKPAADGPRYKALGNSMAVPVMRWILSRIDVQNCANVCKP